MLSDVAGKECRLPKRQGVNDVRHLDNLQGPAIRDQPRHPLPELADARSFEPPLLDQVGHVSRMVLIVMNSRVLVEGCGSSDDGTPFGAPC